MFEYTAVAWSARDAGGGLLITLNELGAKGWEAVGMTPRSWPAPMGGMGADVTSEVVVLLKRPKAT